MMKRKSGKLYWSIIGAGQIAGGFDHVKGPDILTHVKALKKNPHVKDISVVEVNAAKRKAFCKKWGLTRSFAHINGLLNAGVPDAVSVCTPPETHDAIIRQLVKGGVKVILCEKPLASTWRKGRAIADMCRKRGVKLFVNYPRNFDPNFWAVARLIQNKSIGKLQKVNGYYMKGVENSFSHVLNLLRMFFGEIKDVKSLGGALSQDKNFPSPDILVQHRNIQCLVHALNYRDYSIFELDVVGNKGRIRILKEGEKIEIYGVKKNPLYPSCNSLYIKETLHGTFHRMMAFVIDDVVQVCRKKKKYNNAMIQAAADDLLCIEKILKRRRK